MSKIGNNFTQKLTIGGRVPVCEGINFTTRLIGGQILPASMPVIGNALPSCTPVSVNEETKVMSVHYEFEVYEAVAAAGKSIKVKKMLNNTLAKVDMCLGVAPSDISTTVASAKITAIDTTNEAYDVLTISKALGALAVGDILVEVDKETAGADTDAAIKVKPDSLTLRDYELMPYGKNVDIHADSFWALYDGEIYAKRVSPICPAVRKHLREQGCVLRFTNI